MVETFKYKDRVIFAVGLIATAISGLGVSQVTNVLPTNLQFLAPTIVGMATLVVAQLSTEKRVDVAEEIKTEEILAQNGI